MTVMENPTFASPTYASLKLGSKFPVLPLTPALECNCANFGKRGTIGIWSNNEKEDKQYNLCFSFE